MKRGTAASSPRADLDGYKAKWRTPIEFQYRGHEVDLDAAAVLRRPHARADCRTALEGYDLASARLAHAPKPCTCMAEACGARLPPATRCSAIPISSRSDRPTLLSPRVQRRAARNDLDRSRHAFERGVGPARARGEGRHDDALLRRRQPRQRRRADHDDQLLVRIGGDREGRRLPAQQRDGRLRRHAGQRRTGSASSRARRTRSRPGKRMLSSMTPTIVLGPGSQDRCS